MEQYDTRSSYPCNILLFRKEIEKAKKKNFIYSLEDSKGRAGEIIFVTLLVGSIDLQEGHESSF